MKRWLTVGGLILAGAVLAAVMIGRKAPPSTATSTAALPAPTRTERSCNPNSPDTAVIVIHGQSNAANFGMLRYQARQAVDNFDPDSGKCFAAVDPLLGSNGGGGHVGTRLGDLLIESGRYQRVVIATIAIAGASIAELNSQHAARIDLLIASLKAAGLTPTHILFQQGETDARLTTTSDAYVAELHGLVRRFRDAGIAAPFYLSQSTKCDYDKPVNIAPIRQAQLLAADPRLNIRRGPDTDTIGNDGRNPDDGCHMNAIGTLANAALWAAFIATAPR